MLYAFHCEGDTGHGSDCGERRSIPAGPFGRAGIIYVLKRYDMLSQVFISTVKVERIIGLRSKEFVSDSWSSWQRLDNFGCNTLAELKAALANV